MSGTGHFIGVDLAWGEHNRTGLAVLDGSGGLIASTSVHTDDELAAFVAEHCAGTLTAAIDAPLIVPNESGRRPCEALVGQLFGRFGAGAYPANRGNPSFNPQPRGARLAARFGWALDPGIRPGIGRRVGIEVYPHPAMVSLFDLDHVIPYKIKKGRELSALRASYTILLDHMEGCCDKVLRLTASPRWSKLRRTAASAVRKSELDRIEDEIDAIFCAYLAWLWATDPDAMVVLGDVDTGYIVTPRPPGAPRQTQRMATQYFTASSVDGFIADPDNSLSWLLSRDVDASGPMAYQRFEESVGVLVMGATTYQWILDHEVGADGSVTWPYEIPCWVFTHRDLPRVAGDIRFVQGPVAPLHPEMVAAAAGRNVWVVGGGDLAGQFADAGLLDEVWIQYAPVSLGAGAPLLPRRLELRLEEVARNADFACARYSVVPPTAQEAP